MIRKSIPSILTMCSLLSGLAALFLVFNSDFSSAVYAIFIAAFFDFIDGFAARLLNVTSAFGKELDSLSDMVSFGVLPGVAGAVFSANVLGVYHFSDLHNTNSLDLFIIFIPLLITVFSALRLAKFNIDENQKDSFIGAPTPAITLFVFAFILAVQSHGGAMYDKGLLLRVLLSVVFFTSAIMLVLPVKLFALKFKNIIFKENWYRYFLLVGGLFLLIYFGFLGFVIIIPSYIILSVGLNLFCNKERS